MKNLLHVASNTVGRGVYPQQMAWLLEAPWRRLLTSPARHAVFLELKAHWEVLEVGSGSGYFSLEVARRLPQGRLELFDLQAEMLHKAKRKMSAENLVNAGYTQGDAARLPFAEKRFDLVYMANVLGEIEDRAACLQSIRRVLKDEGRLSITEHRTDPDYVPIAELGALLKSAGFRRKIFAPRCWAYTAVFEKG